MSLILIIVHKVKQLIVNATQEHPWRQLMPGWQDVWEELGRCLGLLLTPVAWDFTPEQTCSPGSLVHHLKEGSLPCPDETH